MEHADYAGPAILRELGEILRRAEQGQNVGQVPWCDLDIFEAERELIFQGVISIGIIGAARFIFVIEILEIIDLPVRDRFPVAHVGVANIWYRGNSARLISASG